MNRKLTVGLMAAALAAIPASAAMADGHEDAEVVLVHGVPGLDTEVDVLADGDPIAEGIDFEDTAVLNVPAGTYDLAVAPTGAGADEALISADGVEVAAGGSYSAIAYLQEGGEPALWAAGNVTDEGAGIQVFHAADFPAVDILPTEATGLEGVTNGDTAFIATGAGDVEGVGVAAAGEDEAAIDLGTVTVPENTSVLAYAIGDADTVTVVTEAIDVAGEEADDDAEETEQPEEVHSGTGGLLESGLPLWVAGLMALGAAGVAVPAVATARRRN
jgi:hypothetical protein